MSTPPSLADELRSLRIERAQPDRSRPRFVVPAFATAAVVALLALLWLVVLPRFRTSEVSSGSVVLVTPSQGAQLLVATGYVVPQRQANVSPRIGGRVSKLLIEDGTIVKAGQLLAVLEDADYRAQLALARADLASAEARQKRAEVDLADARRSSAREEMVQAKGVSTPQARDQAQARLGGAQAQLAAARADVVGARARIDVAKVNLDNCFVRAPFDGRITQKLTDVGEIVFGAVGAGAGGRGGIASLADFTTLQVEADVSESQVAKLTAGTPAEIALDAFPDRRLRGKVAEVRPRVDRSKATVTVKVAFVDPTTDVLPDMGAKVTFLARELDEASAKAAPQLAVPPDAIVDRNGHKVVFTIGAEGAVQEAAVEPGAPLGNLVALRKGPEAGTHVVRQPPADLHGGARVKEKQ